MDNLKLSIRNYLRKLDFYLVIPCLIASGYGLTLVLAATATSSRLIARETVVQAIAIGIGIVAMLIIAAMDLELLTDLWPLIYGVGMLAILVTILFGYGPTVSGNHNWLRLGPVSVQPSEFVKLAFILVFAKLLDRVKENINQPTSLLYLGAVGGSMLALLAMQGDMGTTLVFLFIAVVMVFCAGLSWRYFAAVGGVVVLAAPVLWNTVLTEYMKNRILYGFRPELDPSDIGFQALQSKIAIGSGQLTGKGFLKGTQINFLPAGETDFIYATAGEEFGFFGSMAVLFLLLFILMRILTQARRSSSDVGSLVCMGVFGLYFAQTFENIGMCLALLPVVGITLPFFSYGGSSMISCWCAIGLVLAVNRQRINTLSFD